MPVVKFTNKVSVKPPHIHIKRQTEEFILYFVLSGEMYLKEGSREYALKPGDMLILDPHLVHCGTKASSCTYFYIHFYHDRMAECSGPEELVKNELVSSRFAALQTDECSIRKNPASSILLPKHTPGLQAVPHGLSMISLLSSRAATRRKLPAPSSNRNMAVIMIISTVYLRKPQGKRSLLT